MRPPDSPQMHRDAVKPAVGVRQPRVACTHCLLPGRHSARPLVSGLKPSHRGRHGDGSRVPWTSRRAGSPRTRGQKVHVPPERHSCDRGEKTVQTCLCSTLCEHTKLKDKTRGRSPCDYGRECHYCHLRSLNGVRIFAVDKYSIFKVSPWHKCVITFTSLISLQNAHASRSVVLHLYLVEFKLWPPTLPGV